MVSLSPDYEGGIVKIVMNGVFKDGHGGHLRMMSLENSRVYFARLVAGQLISYNVSIGVFTIGIILLFLRLVQPRRKDQPSIVSLGITAVIVGSWLANDTGMLRLIADAVMFGRILDYACMHIGFLPLMAFIYSLTRERKKTYLILAHVLTLSDVTFFLVMRYVFDRDMSKLTGFLVLYILLVCLLISVMLFSDRKYCKKTGIERDLRFFFVGLGVLFVTMAIDVSLYLGGLRSMTGRGIFSRIGFCVFFVTMGIETLRLWSREQTTIRRDRFINKTLQYAVSSIDPEESIRSIMEHFGSEFHADHVYLYENRHDGTFHNTYEWFEEGATRPADVPYADLPYEGLIDISYEEFMMDHRLYADNTERTRQANPALHELICKLGIDNLVVGPLEAGGNLIGMFGIDNVPREKSNEIAELIWLMSYFLTQLLIQRDEKRNLQRMSYMDSLTGVANRRALDEFEETNRESYPYGYIMCDINGLKVINDNYGHDEGDKMIIDVSTCLSEVFGHSLVFRLGGDEFVAYSFTDSERSFNALVDRVRALIAGKNRSASIGAVYVSNASAGRKEAKERAEELMYAEKEVYYQGRNDRRR